ncbi:hypothetical protein C7451_103137 [Blastomonas natatoria]|uniref:Phosphatidate cytidylyltransferase n=1 Tax=Blastomonas natatoria TaxID=34015 RepID=A0A2V3VN62_9SPHN|nr:hypothetical protein [Blastomonas natatoria]PXW78029.1 hypothetical protein C7451_103137 [Blastomonas natatoria]
MDSLQSLIAAEALQPIDPRVTAFAKTIVAPFGDTARAVIFYGSCLREAQLDGLMLDFYVIVSDYGAAYRAANKAGWMARANALIPPNVFPAAHDNLAAKYAVLSEADLARACSMQAGDVSVWARFAQPVRIVWSADADAEARAIDALCAAPVTLLRHAAPVAGSASADPLHVWRTGFTRTYGAELRAERGDRPDKVVDFAPDHYAAVGEAIAREVPDLAAMPRDEADARWAKLRARGKRLTVARLAKASFTFAGGIDYLAWKINRHAGTQIEIQPWQRKWPLVAALFLVPRLLKSGAVK